MKTFIQGLFISICAALAPIKAVMITVGILIVADLITGVIAARKRNEKISSARLRDSISKCLIYQTAIITGFLVQNYIMDDVIPIVKIVGSAISMVELTSLYENLNTISGTNIFKEIIDRLGSKNRPTETKED